MAKRCEICGKEPIFGHNVSHSHRLTSRRWNPNLQRVKVKINGSSRRLRICTECLKSGKVQKIYKSTI
ncbi:MAG: 50S ribosomal protein L28 [Acidobacteriota bacterium]